MSYAQAGSRGLSARRSATETQRVVHQTIGKLKEQLNRISVGVDDVSNSVRKSKFLLQSQKPFGWVKNIFKKDRVPASRGKVPARRLPSIKSQYLILFTLCTWTNWRRAPGVDIYDVGDDIWLAVQ